MVLQDPVLFSTSVYENIAYARPDAPREQVIEAAQAAHAHDFIGQMPEGYDTEVGERGLLLSGGERQRIALARAFLKDAPILILDEPTSAVDNQTESLIMDALNHLMEGRTTLMIAHRTQTLSRCDRILRVEAGRISDAKLGPEAASVLSGGEDALE
jgi:ATP-binding cassette subfamily B protein